MEIKNNLTKEELNTFLINCPLPQFLQSFEWGEFQKSLNKKVWRFGVIEDNRLQAVCQLIEQPLPLTKSYLYAPRGPVIVASPEKILKLILKEARDLTVETKTREEIFLKIEPILKNEELTIKDLPLKKVKAIQPKDTLTLNLTKDETTLLTEMHPKTRYNVRLAEKKGIVIRKGSGDEFENFWQLLEQTANRDKFQLHPKNYYKKMLQILKTGDKYNKNELFVELWLAEAENKLIAGALIGYFGNAATYLHGGSAYKYHQLMAPYLLHWQIIKDAKNRGFQNYDFWGITPQNVKNEQPGWGGLTRFKRGFGGTEINYAGTFDFVYDYLWYNLYNIAKKFI